MKKLIIILMLFSMSSMADIIPNPKFTRGANDPSVIRNVTVEDICEKIKGVPNPKFKPTTTVRNVNPSLRKKIYAEYGLSGNHTGYCKDLTAYGPDGKLLEGRKDEGCEIDHDCSLEHGCNNGIETDYSANNNLWPQPYFGQWNAHVKDRFENYLHNQICSGNMTMEQAQKEISGDWISSYKKHPELPLPK